MKPASEPSGAANGRHERKVPRSIPAPPDGAPRDAAVRHRVETLAQAIREKNLDEVMAHYATDVIVYDVMPPLNVRGAAEYRKNFERWFESMEGPINYEMQGLRISPSETHAFSHCLSHVTGTRKGGDKADYWVRVTACFRELNGQWLIAHEHISMPATM